MLVSFIMPTHIFLFGIKGTWLSRKLFDSLFYLYVNVICHCVFLSFWYSSSTKKEGTTTAKMWETSANSYLHSCGELLRILGTYYKRLEGTLSSSIHRWATHSTTERKHYSSYTLEKVCVITNVTSCFGKVIIVVIHLNLYDFWRRSLLHGGKFN